MSQGEPLNLFYEEPDPDRWFPFDRYPRRVIRTVVRGAAQPRGTMRAFLNLVDGLDRLGMAYRINDYRRLRRGGGELACVFGKPHVLDRIPPYSPILFGTSIYSHPNDHPDLPRERDIRRVLVPSPWVQRMFETVWPGLVSVWPVGIDTDRWTPGATAVKDIDVLIYDKIAWERERYQRELIEPLYAELRRRKLRMQLLSCCFQCITRGRGLGISFRAPSVLLIRHCLQYSCHSSSSRAFSDAMSTGVPSS